MIRLIILLMVLGVKELSSFEEVKLNSSKERLVLEVEESCTTEPFSEYHLKQYLIKLGIKHPEIVFAQSVLETGQFRSRIFRENHNLFGMKLARKRFSTAIGERYSHAVYNNWKESVDDYLLWQNQWQITPIEQEWQYYKLLDYVYAEDTSYVKVVKIVRKQNQDLI